MTTHQIKKDGWNYTKSTLIVSAIVCMVVCTTFIYNVAKDLKESINTNIYEPIQLLKIEYAELHNELNRHELCDSFIHCTNKNTYSANNVTVSK